MMTEARIRLAHSAGGVAYRSCGPEGDSAVEIALIATRGGTRWQLPKGTVEAGETSLQTALREVAEETGLTTRHHTFLKTVEFAYWDTYLTGSAISVRKRVDFYLLQVTGGRLSDASFEVDDVGWFAPEEALNRLTFQNEREVVALAMEYWQ